MQPADIFVILFFGIGALIGFWALACLVSALAKKGPAGLIKGYFCALAGKNLPDDEKCEKISPDDT